MIARILLFLLLVPVVEIYAIRRVYAVAKGYWGAQMAVEAIILAFIVLAYVGIKVIKRQGANLVRDFKSGEAPSDVALNGVVLVLSGILLMIPGFVTDVVALLILTPPLRSLLARRMGGAMLRRFMQGGGGFRVYHTRRGAQPFTSAHSTTIDPASRQNGRVIDVEVLDP